MSDLETVCFIIVYSIVILSMISSAVCYFIFNYQEKNGKNQSQGLPPVLIYGLISMIVFCTFSILGEQITKILVDTIIYISGNILTMDNFIRWLAIIGGMAIVCFPFRFFSKEQVKHPVLKGIAFLLVFLCINSLVISTQNENSNEHDELNEATKFMMYPSTMTVSVVASIHGDTTVGNEWSKYFSVNNSPLTGTTQHEITIWQGQNLTALTRIVEEDGVDDVGIQLSEHTITRDDLKYGFSIRQEIEVKEENGRFSGNSVEWTVVYSFTP